MPASDSVGRDNLQRTAIQEPASSPQPGTATDKTTRGDERGSKTKSEGSAEDASKNDEKQSSDARAAEDKREAERSPEEQREVEQKISELKSRDTEVRTHEQAHAAVGGQYAGSPSYEYERGPNGKSYAVGGEVPIDVSVVPGDPQATIQKMQVVRRAALAPAEPSAADRSIAADASIKASQARAELAKANAEITASSPEEGDNEERDGSTEVDNNDNRVQGPVRKSLEGDDSAGNNIETAVDMQRKTLSAPERGNMIADYYNRRVSPSSETGFSATA